MADLPEDQAGLPGPIDSLLPCDACRRRKVKCSKTEPCDRCVGAGLRCTRDIARKKRGPKKGSGSVIAKLRDEILYTSAQDLALPAFDLSQLQLQMPSLNRTMSGDSPLDSPLTSPTTSHFSDALGPASDPANVPRSVPLGMQNGAEFEPNAYTAFTQAGIQLPASWQMQPSEQLLLQAPISPTGYLSVSDLAQQIFPEPVPTSAPKPTLLPPRSNAQTQAPSRTSTPMTQPGSIDAMLKSNTASPSTTTTGSPTPLYGPKYLYRSDSGNLAIEPRIQGLSSEVGMSASLMSQCIRQYFRHLYPIRPMIHESSFHQRMQSNEDLSNEEKILILSLCAMTVLHAAPQSDLSMEKKWQLGTQFLNICFFLRSNADWAESATLLSVQASYHICVALFELKKPRAHHFYIREAIGMAIDQGLHLDATYVNMDDIQAICARRTFAILFITERGLSILRNKPNLITQIPPLTTEYFDEQDGIVLAGFSALVNLFSILDDKFVKLWSSNSASVGDEPLDNVAILQHNLNETTFDHFAMTDIQKADVLITHQWLRLIFWQASMRQGLISYSAADPIFSSSYPITIAKDLCTLITAHQLSYDSILVHGLGIFEKLFEIAYTLMDALTIANFNWSDSLELRYLFDVLAASPNSQSTYVKMLTTKIESERSQASSPHGVAG